MRSIVSPLDGFASPFGPQRGFNPLRIFANDEPGVFFEANDATTLFTDTAGTTPVTAPGDAIALQLDKSQNLQLGPELVTNGTFDTDTDWTKGAGWAISGGVASNDGASGFTLLEQDIGSQVGKTYLVTFNVVSGGIADVRLGGPTAAFSISGGTSTASTGTYSFVGVVPAGGNSRVYFTSQSGAAGSLDNISVRELPGNHRTQATTAARPLYALHPVGGVRNLLQYTEEFDNAIWITGTKTNSTRSDGSITINASGGYGYIRQQIPLDGANTASFDVVSDIDATGVGIRFADNAGGSGIVVDFVAGVSQRIELTRTSSSSSFGEIGVEMRSGVVPGVSSDSGFTITFNRAQIEESSTATNYQKVRSFLDVSEEGKARRGRIWYNGTSHFMETGTITPGTDKVQVFAGVRKLSVANTMVIAEISANADTNNGVFVLANVATSGNSFFRSKGTIQADTNAVSSVAPITRLVSGLGDISGNRTTLRIDGVQEAISTADQGTGNYLAYPLYFGARAGTSLFYNGYEDTSIIRFGPNLDDTTISKVESYVASKTPEPTL